VQSLINWNTILVGEYLEILDLESEDLTPTEILLERASILSGENYEDINEDELEQIINDFKWLDTAPLFKKSEIKYNKLKFGAFIDNEFFTTEKIPIQNITKIVSVILGFEDFESKCNEIEEMLFCEAYPILEGYLNYRIKLLQNYEDLFESNEDEEIDEEDIIEIEGTTTISDEVFKRWNWERVLWELSGGDITKIDSITEMTHLTVFNWLTMIKDLKLSRPI
jgi:hypothetical protein